MIHSAHPHLVTQPTGANYGAPLTGARNVIKIDCLTSLAKKASDIWLIKYA